MSDDNAEAKGRRLGDAAARLTQDTSDLVREQVRGMREEFTARAAEAGVGAGLLAAGGVCGMFALCSAHQTALRALESALPRTRAVAALTLGYGVAATALTVAGLKKVRETTAASGEALDQTRRGFSQEFGNVSS
jgi:hypothetical protein